MIPVSANAPTAGGVMGASISIQISSVINRGRSTQCDAVRPRSAHRRFFRCFSVRHHIVGKLNSFPPHMSTHPQTWKPCSTLVLMLIYVLFVMITNVTSAGRARMRCQSCAGWTTTVWGAAAVWLPMRCTQYTALHIDLCGF